MIPIEIDGVLAQRGILAHLGAVEAELVQGGGDAAGLNSALEHAEALVPERLEGRRPQDLPAIAATRAAYKRLGKDPARYRPAAEALLRCVVQKKELARINPAVDVNNLVSLETGFSIGTYDLSVLAPPLVLRCGTAGESYEAIGRGPLNLEDLPVLADRRGAFGSPTADSVRSRVEATTSHILMVLIGFDDVPVSEANLAFAAALLDRYVGTGHLETWLVRRQG